MEFYSTVLLCYNDFRIQVKEVFKVKLRKVDKDNWQKCCRWCHYYYNGKCFNKSVIASFSEDSINTMYEVAESGRLSEVIEETLHSVKLSEFKELEYKLREWKVSEKRIKEFNDLFMECYSQFTDFTLKEKLDEDISRCYLNFESNQTDGVEIFNPEEFCCRDWC